MEKKTIKPGKDIVASMVQDLKKELQSIVSEGAVELEIDLDGVEMIDSVGLGAFIATHNSLSKAGGKLSVVKASEDIYNLFLTMRLDKHFSVNK